MGMESFKPKRESQRNDQERVKDKEKAERMARAGDVVGRSIAAEQRKTADSILARNSHLDTTRGQYEYMAEVNDRVAETHEEIEGSRYDQEKKKKE